MGTGDIDSNARRKWVASEAFEDTWERVYGSNKNKNKEIESESNGEGVHESVGGQEVQIQKMDNGSLPRHKIRRLHAGTRIRSWYQKQVGRIKSS